MAVSLMAKGLTAYLVIGVILTLMGGSSASGLDNELAGYFINQSTGQLSSDLTDSLPNVNEETGSDSGILAFIDSVRAVRSFIIFISTVGLAIPMVLLDLNIPPLINVLVGIPLTFLLLLGIAYFVRSGS